MENQEHLKKDFNKFYKFLKEISVDGTNITNIEDTIRWGKGLNKLNAFKVKFCKDNKDIEIEFRSDGNWILLS